ncbi:MAG: hypothetical protein RLO48_20165, partial [Bauldia litoralis]
GAPFGTEDDDAGGAGQHPAREGPDRARQATIEVVIAATVDMHEIGSANHPSDSAMIDLRAVLAPTETLMWRISALAVAKSQATSAAARMRKNGDQTRLPVPRGSTIRTCGASGRCSKAVAR